MIQFIEYPKCSTCKKAKKYLDDLHITYQERHIVEDRLTKDEIKALHKKSGYPLKKFFNTSGMKYRELNLKDKLPQLSEDQQYELLASDGMLVKRPIVETDSKVLVGFRSNEYDSLK